MAPDLHMIEAPIVDSPVSPQRPLPRPDQTRGRMKRTASRLLSLADVQLDGERAWDVRVRDDRFFRAIALRGITGMGDAYVEGWWECDALDELFERAFRAGLSAHLRWHPYVLCTRFRDHLVNAQTRSRAIRNGRAHYNLGNDLFAAMLDSRMVYSCGYWQRGTRSPAATLDEAQEAKLDLVCRKLNLAPGMTLLDIGCGWGSLVKHAAERFGVRAVGITVSDHQATLARERCQGLEIDIRLQDYRQLDERFDRIASIGMFEHVGQRNHRTFMNIAHRCLNGGGLFLLHTIAARDSFPNCTRSEVDWIERHIFPGLVIPSMKQIGAAADNRFIVEDLENFGADYDPTLIEWCANFDRAWPILSARYPERFRRMWRYYLLIAAGAFRARAYQVWQFVLSKEGVRGGYQRPLPQSAASSTTV